MQAGAHQDIKDGVCLNITLQYHLELDMELDLF